MSTIQLYKGDCLEVMDVLIAMGVKVDAVITDPPYGTTACSWDSIIPFDKMWASIEYIRKPTAPIILFASQPFTTNLISSNMKNYSYELIWKKKCSYWHDLS